MTHPAPAVCEIEFRPGQQCGVPAVGRCATCGRAFCRTHQGRAPSGVAYIDLCSQCNEQRNANEREHELQQRAKEKEAEEYVKSGAARKELHASGVRPAEVIWQEWRLENQRRLFKTTYAQTVTTVFVGRGWILDKSVCSWKCVNVDGQRFTEYPLTALLDNDPASYPLTDRFDANAGLVPVEPYLDGYEIIERRGNGGPSRLRNYTLSIFFNPIDGANPPRWVGTWSKIAQAVHELVATAS